MISPSLKHKVGIVIFSSILVRNKRFNYIFDMKIAEILEHKKSLKAIIAADPSAKNELSQKVIDIIVSRLTPLLCKPEQVII